MTQIVVESQVGEIKEYLITNVEAAREILLDPTKSIVLG